MMINLNQEHNLFFHLLIETLKKGCTVYKGEGFGLLYYTELLESYKYHFIILSFQPCIDRHLPHYIFPCRKLFLLYFLWLKRRLIYILKEAFFFLQDFQRSWFTCESRKTLSITLSQLYYSIEIFFSFFTFWFFTIQFHQIQQNPSLER